jgi:predicted transcriptional regulator
MIMSKIKSKVDVMYSIRITKEMEDKLCRIAEAEGRTKTNVIRHYLEIGLRTSQSSNEVESEFNEEEWWEIMKDFKDLKP